MRKALGYIFAPIRRFIDAPLKIAIPIIAAAAFIMNLILEICLRHSFVGALVHMATSFHIFFANMSIIFFTMLLCLLLKQRIAMMLLISVLWLALGITNAVLISFRSSPFSAIDFLIIKDALNVVHTYIPIPLLVVLCILILAVIVGIVFLFIKCPRSRVNYLASSISVISGALICVIMFSITSSINLQSADFIMSYHKKGFAYCFTESIFFHGIDRPDKNVIDKKDDLMDQLHSGTDSPIAADPTKAPNIVVVQLESFFDPKYINGVEFSKDPVPNFTRLRNECISGNLQVAHLGGGTANIEFEFLTGMNLNHFGVGEFPYTTILKTRACETIAANLKNLDYTTHAIHNHIATFYGRNIVYPYLGFDTFTPLEMMTDIEKTYLTFSTDKVLLEEIRSALNSTDGQDFVFAVSVEGHGGYPHWQVDFVTPGSEGDIEVYGLEDDKKAYYQYYFYANLINSMDNTVQQICSLMDQTGEPYVLVFYGDHLPALPIAADQLDNGDLYKTEYIIKTNIELPGTAGVTDMNELDLDLETYQLASYIQKLCGLSEGDITKLHQHEIETGEMYDDVLQALEYEQLYDEQPQFHPTDMVIGTRSVIVESIEESESIIYVHGFGFNEFSTVLINGSRRETEFIDSSTLRVKKSMFDSGDLRIEVAQIANDGTELARAVNAFE